MRNETTKQEVRAELRRWEMILADNPAFKTEPNEAIFRVSATTESGAIRKIEILFLSFKINQFPGPVKMKCIGYFHPDGKLREFDVLSEDFRLMEVQPVGTGKIDLLKYPPVHHSLRKTSENGESSLKEPRYGISVNGDVWKDHHNPLFLIVEHKPVESHHAALLVFLI